MYPREPRTIRTKPKQVRVACHYYFAGQLSIVHSYYVPIWGVSLFALMFCSLFHDPVIHKIEGAVCLAFIAAAALQHNLEYPEQFNYTVECLIVTEVTGIGICYLAFLLEKHSRRSFSSIWR